MAKEGHRSIKKELSMMRQRSDNLMEAILAAAAAYMEVNLTQDKIYGKSYEYAADLSKYSDMHRWICDNLIVGNRSGFAATGNRESLLEKFEKGKKRISVTFTMKIEGEAVRPYRKAFFLYREQETGDVWAFCVIYDMTEEQKREREMKMLEDELRMSRIRNFTSQMQPHFLYNSLGSIQEIMLTDPDYASELLGYFTVYLRSCVQAMTRDEPLQFKAELENIKAYLNIEKMRFGSKLRIHFDIRATDFYILPLTIQPIVENSIRHGIYSRGPAGGDVYIRAWEEDNCFIVQVEDNGTGFDIEDYKRRQEAGEETSTGLRNVSFRLEHVMRAGLEVNSRIGEGTTVTVRIPKSKGAGRNESNNS